MKMVDYTTLMQPIFLMLFFALSYIVSRKFFDNDLRITALMLAIFMIIGTYIDVFPASYYVFAIIILIFYMYTLFKKNGSG
jgi:hypothetical protein